MTCHQHLVINIRHQHRCKPTTIEQKKLPREGQKLWIKMLKAFCKTLEPISVRQVVIFRGYYLFHSTAVKKWCARHSECLILTLVVEINIKLIFWDNFFIRESIFWWCELLQVSNIHIIFSANMHLIDSNPAMAGNEAHFTARYLESKF